jgi:hypothetical protein
MNPGPSLLDDELFRRRHRLRAEIVVPGVGNTHEALGRADQAIEPLAERPCTTSTGAVTLPTRRSERNWSFMKSRTGTNQ